MSVMLHGSMRKIGPIEGRAEGLLDTLRQMVGEEGSLIMPLGADPVAPFDAQHSPAHPDMGVLAEIFRVRPAVCVNDHAASRWAVEGPASASLLKDPPLHDYHGPGSLLQRFAERPDSHVLRLGADVDTVTLTHWAEYLAKVPHKQRTRVRYIRADIGEQFIEGLDDDDGIVDWGEEEDDDYFSQIFVDFVSTGHVSQGPVAGCLGELFHAQTFVDFAVRWMEREFPLIED